VNCLRLTSLGLGGQVGVGPWLNGPGGSRCGGPGVTGLVEFWCRWTVGHMVSINQSNQSSKPAIK